ncbi:CVNH domain-containing protein [Colletotrichum musicola]|uniref:CVNH domain-containing protein n=1 Tax=Colletotrichum musicola TaxID=2175873 RepID=A0A8H6KFG6_9PEZI|nr:CVNH domain-containing protein [Colletotrichum musicola]
MKPIHAAVGLLGGLVPLANAHPHPNNGMATQAEPLETITTTSTLQASSIVPSPTVTAVSKQGDDAAPVSGFANSCADWTVWDFGNYMWANCPDGGDLWWSRLDLDHILGNVGGRLVYQKEGYFSSSCVSCGRKQGTRSDFQCSCPDGKGNFHETSLDLNLYLGNMNGFLCSDCKKLTGLDPNTAMAENLIHDMGKGSQRTGDALTD